MTKPDKIMPAFKPGTMMINYNANNGQVYISDATSQKKIRSVSSHDLLYAIYDELKKLNRLVQEQSSG